MDKSKESLEKLKKINQQIDPNSSNHIGNTVKTNVSSITGIKIDSIKLKNFRFFLDSSFDIGDKNTLIYGENGSGKSSIFKAFELLAKIGNQDITDEFIENKNIFHENKDSSIEFGFKDYDSIVIDDAHCSIDNSWNPKNEIFIKSFSILQPNLDYKKLLAFHYATNTTNENINISKLLKELFNNYPIEDGNLLKDIKNPRQYYEKLEDILKNEFKDDINEYLKFFDENFQIKEFIFDEKFADDGKIETIIHLDLDFFEKKVLRYHLFLNEARLTALGISIYFAIINKKYYWAGNSSLKVLVLDDLLISLDMNNRLNLIKLLQEKFESYQIFFFTHDKNLFDEFKSQMDWKSFEIYLDNEGNYEKPFIKESLDYFESAEKHFKDYDYPACANYLRKEVERLKKIKDKQEENIDNEDKIFRKFKKVLASQDFTDMQNINASKILGQLKGFKKELDKDRNSSVEIDLKDIKSITDRILNPQSHDNTSKPLYKKELEDAIRIIKNFRDML